MPTIDSPYTIIDSIAMTVQGSNPATPPAGIIQPFVKSDGLYLINSAGTVTGPLAIASTGAAADGWATVTDTWTYASASTFTITGDKTGVLSVGMKIKLTQTTLKYFIISAISYGAPNTTVTVYGGATYTLANAAIASPYYSTAQNPQGFPTSLSLVPGARAYNNADISVNNASLTALTFNSERYDTDAIHDTVTNTGRLTCKTAGKYLIIAQVVFAANATGYRAVYIKLNGATYISIANQTSSGASPATYTIASTIYDLAANDYVEVEVYQTSGGALSVTYVGNLSPEFMMQRIG